MTTRRMSASLLAAVLLAGGAGAYLWTQDREHSRLASELQRDLAASAPDGAVELQTPGTVRERLLGQVEADQRPGGPTGQRAYRPETLQRGLSTAWARAYAGLDDEDIRQSMRLLRAQWLSESASPLGLPPDGQVSYALLAARLSDPAALRQEADALRERLITSRDPRATAMLLLLYADVAAQLDDPEAIRQSAQLVRERMGDAGDADPQQHGIEAYSRLLARLDDPGLHRDALTMFRERLTAAVQRQGTTPLGTAYMTVAEAVIDPALIQQETGALRELLARDCNPDWTRRFLSPHRLLAAKLTVPADITRELASLRDLLDRCADPTLALGLVRSYERLAETVGDPALIQQETDALGERWAVEADAAKAASLALAYATMATRQADSAALAEAAARLRERLDGEFSPRLAEAYAMVVVKLEDEQAHEQLAGLLHERMAQAQQPIELLELRRGFRLLAERLGQPAIVSTTSMLRERLTGAPELSLDVMLASALEEAYRELGAALTDAEGIAEEVAALRERLAIEVDEDIDPYVLRAYAAMAAQLSDPATLRQAASLLRERPLPDYRGGFDFSPPSFAGLQPASFDAESLRSPHARLVAKLTDPAAVREELAALRDAMLAEADPQRVYTLAQAYAALASTVLAEQQRNGDRSALTAEVRQLLVLAGHPFLSAPDALLAVLEPVSGQPFGPKLGAAVRWWRAEFKGDPASLRPGT